MPLTSPIDLLQPLHKGHGQNALNKIPHLQTIEIDLEHVPVLCLPTLNYILYMTDHKCHQKIKGEVKSREC